MLPLQEDIGTRGIVEETMKEYDTNGYAGRKDIWRRQYHRRSHCMSRLYGVDRRAAESSQDNSRGTSLKKRGQNQTPEEKLAITANLGVGHRRE